MLSGGVESEGGVLVGVLTEPPYSCQGQVCRSHGSSSPHRTFPRPRSVQAGQRCCERGESEGVGDGEGQEE